MAFTVEATQGKGGDKAINTVVAPIQHLFQKQQSLKRDFVEA